MMLPDWNSLDSVRLAHARLEAGGLVFFALLVIAEIISHTAKGDQKKHVFETIGIWVFAVAVLCEIGGYRYGERNDDLSGQVIISLDQKANDAVAASGVAVTESNQARTTSSAAGTVADGAMKTAQEARKESDSFEKDIVSAKALAADAETHLADAMKRADVLTAKLNRLTTARSLPHSSRITASLTAFKGTEYMFTEVCADTECVDLLRDIDYVLGSAEWKRVKSPHRFPGLVLWGGPKDDDGAGIDLVPGIRLSVESQDPNIDSRALATLPQYLRAALALNGVLTSNVTPAENTDRSVDRRIGASTVISISIGRKPLQ